MKPCWVVVKRLLDIAFSLLGIVFLAPLLALVAILVRLDSPGPALYRDERMGRHGKPFTMYKFRSMHIDSPVRRNPDGSTYVAQNDPRVTRVGRVLRRGFDELPQLFNVFRGDMSLVGPRPDPPEALPHYREADKKRLLVRPGLTGLAQVSGRTDIPWRERLLYDLEYVERTSPWLDAKIAVYTVVELIPPLRQRRLKRIK
ncbi:MAG: sugar transferase [Anaerolineae bacterium]|nr:sugar transferase [Anaerolineae bacterium]